MYPTFEIVSLAKRGVTISAQLPRHRSLLMPFQPPKRAWRSQHTIVNTKRQMPPGTCLYHFPRLRDPEWLALFRKPLPYRRHQFVIAQSLQLRARDPELRTPNTLKALRDLEAGGHLTHLEAVALEENFTLLRTVEKILRRQDERSRTRVPTEGPALKTLARAAGFTSGEDLLEDLKKRMEANRRIFESHLGSPPQ